MPFHKWVTGNRTSDKKLCCSELSQNNEELDVDYTANKKLIYVMRQLAELITIADDIFGAINNDCRKVIHRTKKLKIKIRRCQVLVDNFNPKTVVVPFGCLSSNQLPAHRHENCHANETSTSSLFFTLPRPPAVDRLRHLANGPSPPVVIPSCKVAPEADVGSRAVSSSSSLITHIYCQPLQIKDLKSLKSADLREPEDNLMSSAVKVPSSVVPIDVSGEPFSRMTSFRRSLIHVDFLIRRKKKDKRRNTVAEGDTKEMKKAFQNIINDDARCPTMQDEICSQYEKIIVGSKNDFSSKVFEESDHSWKSHSNEKNNNSANESFHSKCNLNSVKTDATPEKNKTISSKNDRLKLDLKNNFNSDSSSKLLPLNRKKPKSHIPISTISAAMSVAVEMRQQNGIKEGQSSSVNWNSNSDNNSSDSENKFKSSETNRGSQSSSINEGSSFTENCFIYRDRLKEKGIFSSNLHKKTAVGDKVLEAEECSSASSDNYNLPGDDITSEETSTESDAFFISSDESDEEVSSVSCFQEKYGSSTSLSTISDGSLNSLLSQTASEMNTSTGTLTSVGKERLPTPPPPPPMVLVATTEEISNVTVSKCVNSELNDMSPVCNKIITDHNALKKFTRKSKASQKHSKPFKTELVDLQRNITENSKNIFSTLVNMKIHSKEQQKLRPKDNKLSKLNKMPTQPVFDMYGNNSPKKPKQLPAFINENASPIWENSRKSHMQSFSPCQSGENSNIQNGDKINFPLQESSPAIGPIAVKNPNFNKSTTSENPQTSLDSKLLTIENIKNEVPSKYVHQVTVTPLQRYPTSENSSENICKPPQAKNYRELYGSDYTILNKSNSSYQGNINEIPLSSSNTPIKFHNLNYHSSKRPKSVARVVLDPDGRVIYCTNSLDRKHYASPNSVNSCTLSKQAESFGKQSLCYNKEIYCRHVPQYMDHDSPQTCHNAIYSDNSERESNSVFTYKVRSQHAVLSIPNERSSASTMAHFNSKCDNLLSSEIQGQNLNPERNCSLQNPSISEESVPKFHCRSAQEVREMKLHRNFVADETHFSNRSFVPDPNVSGLPSNDITQCIESLRIKHMQKLNVTPHSFDNVSENLSPLQTDSENSVDDSVPTSKQSTMSTEDLFAVIHNCKKRMNIKTDSDISLASSSSRSSSQSYIRSNSLKGGLAETGFLSPRSPTVNYDASGDRRSWADFRPVESFPSERKSLASDRLGPTKPTSMHDFKMLLLQTRSNSQVPGPRKSAVEMLKVPLSQDKSIKSLPLNLSQRNSISFSVQNSPTSELIFYNGHSTVPFKRGNRVRSSLQSRYTMYPPIFEDCSEESENCRDFYPKHSVKASVVSENEIENKQLKNNSNEMGNFVDNPRLWV